MIVAVAAFQVAAKGVGRKDYSASYDMAVQPTAKGKLVRGVAAVTYTALTTLDFPDFWGIEVPIYTPGGWVYDATEIPEHILCVGLSTSRNVLVGTGLFRYRNDAAFLAGEAYLECFGFVYGYKNVELRFSTGIRTREGFSYVMGAGVWSEYPTHDLHAYGAKIWQGVV